MATSVGIAWAIRSHAHQALLLVLKIRLTQRGPLKTAELL